MTHILYAAPLSLFSGKARAYLTYKQVEFEERFADRDIYRTIIVPRIGYPVMPVTITQDDQAIQDTSELIDYFEDQSPDYSVCPTTPVQSFVAALFELYGDEWLIIPAMHYRWVYNKDFALAEFGQIALPDGTPQEQLAAAQKTSAMFQGAVPLLGATPQMGPAVEASYIGFLHGFNRHLEDHDFLLGGKPCQGDFGLLGPLYAHLYRDPESGKLMKREAPNVAAWVERMVSVPFVAKGGFVADDQIPSTLLPILKRMMAEQGPCLLDLFEKMASLKADDPDKDIPRAIGMHPFTMEGQTGSRMIMPYTQWMAQRAFEQLAPMPVAAQERAHDLLAQVDGKSFIDATITAPVTRVNHRIVWR